MQDFFEGTLVKGKILEIRSNEVLVDIGYKSEGVVPAQEFVDFEGLEIDELLRGDHAFRFVSNVHQDFIRADFQYFAFYESSLEEVLHALRENILFDLFLFHILI